MPRVVLDTNIIISAFVFPGSLPDKVLTLCFSGIADLMTSRHILGEFERVLAKKFSAPPAFIQGSLELLRSKATVVNPALLIEAVPKDPTDNHILECAVWSNAQFIVTGDKAHLLPLDPFRGKVS